MMNSCGLFTWCKANVTMRSFSISLIVNSPCFSFANDDSFTLKSAIPEIIQSNYSIDRKQKNNINDFLIDFTEMNFLHLLLPRDIDNCDVTTETEGISNVDVRVYTNPLYFCVDIFYYMFKFSHSIVYFSRLHGNVVQGNCS